MTVVKKTAVTVETYAARMGWWQWSDPKWRRWNRRGMARILRGIRGFGRGCGLKWIDNVTGDVEWDTRGIQRRDDIWPERISA